MNRSETIALVVTLAIMVSVPAALFGYKNVYLPHHFKGARIITLTALASDGVWTEDSVNGISYWRKHFPPAPEIRVKQGESVVLRLASADVLHSFAIPALNLGPIDVPAGEVREVQFTAKDPNTLLFLCWQVCSPMHGKLQGKIVVLDSNGQIPQPKSTQEPEL